MNKEIRKKNKIQHNNTSGFSWFATQKAETIFDYFKTNDKGLSSQQFNENKKKYGLNKISKEESGLWSILLNQIKSPFIYLLIIIVFIDFILQDFTDGTMILVLVIINTIFGFYQEFRTYHTLQLLKKYIVDHIRVIREGKEVEIKSSELVPGDIVKLYPGDRIPADIRLIHVENLATDEGILTGESVPIQKNSKPLEKEPDIYQATNIGFSGTTVTTGNGLGIVFATGNNTYFSSIVTLAKESPKLTTFMLGISKLSRFILIIVLIVVSFVFFAHVLFAKKLDIFNLLAFSMALGISIIPEALPVVITFSLTRGALHLSKYNIIMKRLSAIEDLGSMNLLCADKTGTLTENKLTLRAVQGKDKRKVIIYSILASGLPPQQLEKDQGFNGPLWHELNDKEKKLIEEYQLIDEHPFEPQLRRSSVLVKHGNESFFIMRGNTEDVLKLCINLDDKQKKEIDDIAQKEGEEGYRVLIIAAKKTDASKITNTLEKELDYCGLISYIDPLKKTAPEAIKRASKLGVGIKIISGDTVQVNYAIAHKINLVSKEDQVISGEEFEKKSEKEKEKIAKYCTIFAHIVPEQKVEIIDCLKKYYDVGYLGDGINDAPALKSAHVSIAVNSAADIARDNADIILLRKSLHVIVDGIYEGRIIFANCVKYIKSTLAANFGHFYSLAIISLLIDFLPIRASQLLLISLMTDIPLIAISTDTVSPSEIAQPKKYDLKEIALVTPFLGIIVMAIDFIVFALFYDHVEHGRLQTNWFIASILIELSFFYSIRTTLPFFKAQFPSWQILTLSTLMALTAISLPFTSFGHTFLYFQTPKLSDLTIIFALLIGYFFITDIAKIIFYHFYNLKSEEQKK
jgi:Mg2+-importing ATPase